MITIGLLLLFQIGILEYELIYSNDRNDEKASSSTFLLFAGTLLFGATCLGSLGKSFFGWNFELLRRGGLFGFGFLNISRTFFSFYCFRMIEVFMSGQIL